jgi:DNA-binding protein H-NS
MAEEEEVVVPEEQGEEEEEIELTDEEKVEALKEQLQQGEIGPAIFDQEFQRLWMSAKADEEAKRLGYSVRGQRAGSTRAV